jgi:hypothetical protein
LLPSWACLRGRAHVHTLGIVQAPLRTPGVSVDANGGNYQTLTSDALLEFVHERSALDAVRQALGEELAP